MKNILSQIKNIDTSKLSLEEGKPFTILITGNKPLKAETKEINKSDRMIVGKSYRITVKKYMTEPATVSFDFQDKWNSGIPMPMITMEGKVIQETRGMYKMKLHAIINDISKPVERCYNCGRALTHPVSRLYGIGPECGRHFYINPFDSIEELKEHLTELQSRLRDIEWEGFVIKSAIKEWEEINNEIN